MAKRFNRVHAICQYLRGDKPCKGCPAWEDRPGYGRGQRACYGIAREVLRIAQHGHPWRPKHVTRKQIKEWRKRIMSRIPPKLRLVN